MKQKKYSHQSGRTFVETLGYIAIMIALTVGFAAIANRTYYKYESSKVQQELVDLKKVISARYAADGNYANVKWNDLCADGLGPKSLMPKQKCTTQGGKRVCSCAVQKGHHAFDGPVNIAPTSDFLLFTITFSKLPKDICSQLGIISWHNGEGSDLEHLKINNKIFRWQPSSSEKKLPAQVSDAVSACNKEYDNTITWYFN